MKATIGLAILMIALVPFVSATATVNVDMNVTNGNIDIDTVNTDSSAHFTGFGGFSGNYNSQEQGSNYLDTNVLAQTTTGASFSFSGHQKLSGYTNNNIEFESFAYGNNAIMNNRFDNSNYVVQLERVDTGKDFLSASDSSEYGIGWRMNVVDKDNSSLSTSGTEVTLIGSGSGILDTNQWHPTSIGSYGWGNPDRINAPAPAGYYTPINTVTATGDGQFNQHGYGDNSLEMNGFTFGSGSGLFTATFSGGFSGAYSVRAN